MPRSLIRTFQAHEAGVRAAWRVRDAMVLRDVSQASLLVERERAALMVLGTRVKMAAPVPDLPPGPRLPSALLQWPAASRSPDCDRKQN